MAKKSPFLVWTPQFWSQDPKKPFPRVPLIGELITLKDTPPILNRFGSRAPTPRKKNTSWPISPLYSIYIYNKKFLTKTKCLKLISNHSMVVSGVYFNPFQGSQGPQEGSEAKILTFWPKKSFYGNAHISGTRRPTGLAQVSKRPLDQGLHAWPFRLSVPLLVSMIA